MNVTITIPPELQPKIEAEAQRLGKEIKRVVEEILARAFSPHPALDELLAPARKEFADGELDVLIKQERKAMRLEEQEEKIDMILDELAKGGENLPPLAPNFSREDTYFDHD